MNGRRKGKGGERKEGREGGSRATGPVALVVINQPICECKY